MRRTAHLRFNIGLLTERLLGATDWLTQKAETASLLIGYFGASTGAAAALAAAAERSRVAAVVSRGGRPDLAGPALLRVGAPTLLIVGGNDEPVIEMNRERDGSIRLEGEAVSHRFRGDASFRRARRSARSRAGWRRIGLPGACTKVQP